MALRSIRSRTRLPPGNPHGGRGLPLPGPHPVGMSPSVHCPGDSLGKQETACRCSVRNFHPLRLSPPSGASWAFHMKIGPVSEIEGSWRLTQFGPVHGFPLSILTGEGFLGEGRPPPGRGGMSPTAHCRSVCLAPRARLLTACRHVGVAHGGGEAPFPCPPVPSPGRGRNRAWVRGTPSEFGFSHRPHLQPAGLHPAEHHGRLTCGSEGDREKEARGAAPTS